jgi:hypothetical protein
VTTVANLDAHPARRLELLIPESARRAIPLLGGSIDEPAAYSLSRCKEGSTVWLHCGRLTENLTLHLKHWPANYATARDWLHGIETRFGLALPERPRKRIGGAKLRLVSSNWRPT